MKRRFVLGLMLASTCVWAKDGKKEKHEMISQADQISILGMQVRVAALSLQIQPGEIQLMQEREALNKAIDQAVRNSGADPAAFFLDLNSWQVVEKPKPEQSKAGK